MGPDLLLELLQTSQDEYFETLTKIWKLKTETNDKKNNAEKRKIDPANSSGSNCDEVHNDEKVFGDTLTIEPKDVITMKTCFVFTKSVP